MSRFLVGRGFWIAVLAIAVFSIACAVGDDDDSSGDDEGSGDDDTGDDDDDDSSGDDDASYDQPYTYCCDLNAQPVAVTDPGLPASGPGPFAFVRIERTFADEARGREIPAVVYLPSIDGTTPSDQGAPYPVVLVVHGFSGVGALVRPYAERLATWGYIAILPDLPELSFFDVFRLSHVQSSIDLLFLANTLCCEAADAASPYYGRIDAARIAAVGHSLGGKLSVMAALADDGVRTVAGIDPVDGAGPVPESEDLPSICPDEVPGLAVPTLYLGGTDGRIVNLGQACAPAEDNYEQFWTYSPPPSFEITFAGADHTDFVTPVPLDPCDIGSADGDRVKALAMEYVVAFLNDRLRGWERFRSDYAGDGIAADVAAGDVTLRRK